ncbi:hypothetical protein ACFLZC_00125 [Patescibacteria group bacterium]
MEKITPQQERAQLQEKITASPENTQEIVTEHAQLTPEEIYTPDYQYSPEQIKEMEKNILDSSHKEKEETISRLFSIAEEKGILNAIKVSKNLPESLMDEFHDHLVKSLQDENKS